MSMLSILLCVAMLIGSTFAWFTDSVTSGRNKITAGNLDVELYHSNPAVSEEEVKEGTELFLKADGKPINWEPGVIAYENFTVKNAGSLALKYELALSVYGKNATTANHSLDEVIKVAFYPGEFSGDRDAAQALDYGDLINTTKTGNIEAKGADNTFAVVLYWQPSDKDDLYNLKNDLTTNDKQALWIDLGVELYATQAVSESDSFGNDYDESADLPELPKHVAVSVTSPINDSAETVIEDEKNGVTATIPEGATTEDSLTLTISTEAATENSVTYQISLVDKEGHDVTLDKDAVIKLNIGAGLKNVTVKHNDEPMDKDHYSYDAGTGILTIEANHFSPFKVDFERDTAWDGTTVNTEWFSADKNEFTLGLTEELAGLAELVNNGTDFSKKTVTLGRSLDLGGKDWTPIGDDSKPFKGTFDGNGCTVENMKIKANNNNDTGFFGKIDAVTVKDLTIANSTIDGTGYSHVGALAGKLTNAGSKVTNVTIDSCTVSGSSYVGGLLGEGFQGTVDGCTLKNVTVNATSDYIGGISGQGYAKISNCTIDGCSITGHWKVGGIIGQDNEGTREQKGHTIKDTTVCGGGGDSVGLIVGFENSSSGNKTFTSCKMLNSTVKMNNTVSVDSCGGAIGSLYCTNATITFEDCHAEGINFETVDKKIDNAIKYLGCYIGGGYWRGYKGSTFVFNNCSASIGTVDCGMCEVSYVGAFIGDAGANTVNFTGENNTYGGSYDAIGKQTSATVSGAPTRQ